jgi:hypothetical protein
VRIPHPGHLSAAPVGRTLLSDAFDLRGDIRLFDKLRASSQLSGRACSHPCNRILDFLRAAQSGRARLQSCPSRAQSLKRDRQGATALILFGSHSAGPGLWLHGAQGGHWHLNPLSTSRSARLIGFSARSHQIFELPNHRPTSDTISSMLNTRLQMAMCCCCTCRVSSGDGVQSS